MGQNGTPPDDAVKCGDVVFFRTFRKSLRQRTLKNLDIGFREGAHGFGVMLGTVPKNAPEPHPVLIRRMMGQSGYVLFDDVIEFLGKEPGIEVVEKFKDKYYGKIVPTEGRVPGETPEVPPLQSLQLVAGKGDEGKMP